MSWLEGIDVGDLGELAVLGWLAMADDREQRAWEMDGTRPPVPL